MGDKSAIEWTDATWNPTVGCTKVSEGCDHCFAERLVEGRMKQRYPDGFGMVRVHPDRVNLPLRWTKPRRVFVNSLSDLFHEQIPDEWRADIFAVMAAARRHTFQVLTKRPGPMASLLNRQSFQDAVRDRAEGKVLAGRRQEWTWEWPLPNVWLGVSVESQKWADVRVPLLLRTPAAVRFLSCEPLLGPVDLSRWLTPVVPTDPATAPHSWSEWTWPDWVPAKIRRQVQRYWAEGWGRGPHLWLRNAIDRGAHPFGATISSPDGFTQRAPLTRGRFVHAWGNVGRLVREDGTVACTPFTPREVHAQRPLHWVIVGGESGPGARPMELGWVYALIDQCVSAEAAVFVKQLGSAWAREHGADPKGGDWQHWQEDLCARQFPREGPR